MAASLQQEQHRRTRLALAQRLAQKKPGPGGPHPSSSGINSTLQQLQKDRRNPTYARRALKLGQQIATGQRDRSKSAVKQVVSEGSARAGQAVGGAIGSLFPGAGTTIGAAIGKRVGRLAGEHWKTTLIILLFTTIIALLPLITLVGSTVVIILTLSDLGGNASWFW